MLRKLTFIVLVISLSGCAELTQLAQQTLDTNAPLTQNEIVGGLKEALITGAEKSADLLGKTDGYYQDELVKILLPPEADVIVQNLNKIPGGDKMLEDVLLRINRAAEDAAKEAAPVFVNSIKSMTITDAMGILKGKDDAATQYLRSTTYNELFALYEPKIKASIDKELVGGISTGASWNALTSRWNTVANSVAGKIAGLKPVQTELEDYLTQKALDGLFLKIANEEKQIRENPAARVSSLLKRVFGSVNGN